MPETVSIETLPITAGCKARLVHIAGKIASRMPVTKDDQDFVARINSGDYSGCEEQPDLIGAAVMLVGLFGIVSLSSLVLRSRRGER